MTTPIPRLTPVAPWPPNAWPLWTAWLDAGRPPEWPTIARRSLLVRAPEGRAPRGPGGPADLAWADLGPQIAAMLEDLPLHNGAGPEWNDPAGSLPPQLCVHSEGAHHRRPRWGLAHWRQLGSLTPRGEDLAQLFDTLQSQLAAPTPPAPAVLETWVRAAGFWFTVICSNAEADALLLRAPWLDGRLEAPPQPSYRSVTNWLELEEEAVGDILHALLSALGAWAFARLTPCAQRRLFHEGAAAVRRGARGAWESAWDVLMLLPPSAWPRLRLTDLETLITHAEASDRAMLITDLWERWPIRATARLQQIGRRGRAAVVDLLVVQQLRPLEWLGRAMHRTPQLAVQVRDEALRQSLRLMTAWSPATPEEAELRERWLRGEGRYRDVGAVRAVVQQITARPQPPTPPTDLSEVVAPKRSYTGLDAAEGQSPIWPSTWGLRAAPGSHALADALRDRLRAEPNPSPVGVAMRSADDTDLLALVGLDLQSPQPATRRRARRVLRRRLADGLAPTATNAQWLVVWGTYDPTAPRPAIARWLLQLPEAEARLLGIRTISNWAAPSAP